MVKLVFSWNCINLINLISVVSGLPLCAFPAPSRSPDALDKSYPFTYLRTHSFFPRWNWGYSRCSPCLKTGLLPPLTYKYFILNNNTCIKPLLHTGSICSNGCGRTIVSHWLRRNVMPLSLKMVHEAKVTFRVAHYWVSYLGAGSTFMINVKRFP